MIRRSICLTSGLGIIGEEHLEGVVEMKLPRLHVMYAAGDDIEGIVFTRFKLGTEWKGSCN